MNKKIIKSVDKITEIPKMIDDKMNEMITKISNLNKKSKSYKKKNFILILTINKQILVHFIFISF